MSFQYGSGGSSSVASRAPKAGRSRPAASTATQGAIRSADQFVSGTKGKSSGKGWRADAEREPDPILFQTYFKSVGPRTYAAQLKRAGNGNHYLVFTEGKRDKVTDELRKISLYVYSEDFTSFFKLLKETAEFVRSHPVPAEVVKKRTRFWEKEKSKSSAHPPAAQDSHTSK